MNRENCAVCNSILLEELYTIKEYPISISSSVLPFNDDKYQDLVFNTCNKCGCVQLKHLIDIKILYQINHNNTYDTPTWKKHHQDFSTFVLDSITGNKIVEVGGSSGTLAKKIIESKPDIAYTLIDLCDLVIDISGITFVQANCEDYIYKSDSTVVMSHIFEHLYKPYDFVKRLKNNNVSSVIISVPDMNTWLNNKYLSFLHVEHTYYCDKETILHIFSRCGYVCKEIKYFHKHSIFMRFILSDNDSESELVDTIIDSSKIKKYFDIRESVLKNIVLTQMTFIVPAGHFGQLIYYFLKDKEKIIGFLDNDTTKCGKRVYGTTHITYPMADIIKYVDTRVDILIHAGPYTDEIKKQLLTYHTNLRFIDIVL